MRRVPSASMAVHCAVPPATIATAPQPGIVTPLFVKFTVPEPAGIGLPVVLFVVVDVNVTFCVVSEGFKFETTPVVVGSTAAATVISRDHPPAIVCVPPPS